MAPESSNTVVPSAVVTGQTVQVPRPDNNTEISVVSSPGGRLDLAFDPSTATTARPEGSNDLVFELDGGGKVTISGFFEVGDNTLPNLTLPDGTVVASTDFFQGSDLDMTTAAGPGAGAGAAGGGTNYDDDGGSLIGGLDKYGKLGTDYWGRETDNDDFFTALTSPGDPELPGGSVDISVTTDVNGIIYGGVFEDAQPFQHEGDRTDFLGKLNFSFTLTGTTVVTGLHISGFPAGTEIYIGEPPVLFVTIGDGDTLSLTAEQIEAGVYLRPPFDTDLDMLTLTSTVDLMATSSGATATVPGPTFTVIVDAAADKPLMDAESSFATPEQEGSITISESESAGHVLRDGWAIDDFDKNTTTVITDPSAVRITAVLTASIQFGDYTDGSETHYALVEVPSYGAWDVMATSPQGVVPGDPAVITLYFDANGKCVGEEPTDASVSSKDYYQFEVPNSVLQQSGGVLDLRLSFTSSDLSLTEDATITLDVGAKAVEAVSDAGELWEGNNKSYTLVSESGSGEIRLPNMVIDTIDSQLHVQVGWASEDNDNSQHVVGSYSPNYAGMNDHHPTDGNVPGVDPNSTTAGGAPIIFSISGSAGEAMTSVKLYFDPNSGDILINGVTQTVHTDAGGSYVELTTANGGLAANGLSTGNVIFSPGVAHSDVDVPMSYEVSVVSSAGASATYTGNTIVVIDAVADLPQNLSASHVQDYAADGEYAARDTLTGANSTQENASSQTIKDGWETDDFSTNQQSTVTTPITFNVSATFPDTDGSETHYVLIAISPGGNWSYTSTPGLTYVGQYTHEGVTYDRFEVQDSSLSNYSGQITVATNMTVSADTPYYVTTGAMAVENAQSTYEYDLVNNVAVTIYPESLAYYADVVESGLKVQVGWASEDNDNSQHVDGAYTPDYQGMRDSHPTDGDVKGIHESSTSQHGAPIIFALDSANANNGQGIGGSGESIASIRLSFTGETPGTLVVLGPDGNAVTITADASGAYTLTADALGIGEFDFAQLLAGNNANGMGLYFQPASGTNLDVDVTMTYTVVVANGAGSTYTFDGSSQVVIDAVADKPVLVDLAPESDSLFLVEIDGKTPEQDGDGYEKATWDSVIRIQASATFSDLTDNSEKHYLLVEAKEGWTCNNADGIVVVDGTSYFYVLATPNTATGTATHNFELVAPSQDAEIIWVDSVTPGDPKVPTYDGAYDYIAQGGGSTTLKAGGLAVEGEIATSSNGTGVVKAGDAADAINVKGSDAGEYDLANNVALTTGEVTIEFNVVNASAEVEKGHGYEDGRPEQHIYYDADSRDTDNVYPELNIGITTQDVREDHIWGTKNGEIADPADPNTPPAVTVTFNFDGDPATGAGLGTFHYNGHTYSLGDGVTYKDGQYTLTIQADHMPKDADGATSLDSIVYKPSGNDDTDLTNVRIGVTVQADNSLTKPTVIWTQPESDNPDVPAGTLVVDAVADKPSDLTLGKEYGAANPDSASGKVAAAPGEVVKVSGSAEFNDNDGSERHYIVVTLQTQYQNGANGQGWEFAGFDGSLLSKDYISDYWAGLSGMTYNPGQADDMLAHVLTPSGNTGASTAPQYLMIETFKDANTGEWLFQVNGGAAFSADNPPAYLASIGFVIDPATGAGTLSYTLNLEAPQLGEKGGDSSSATLYTKAITLETTPDDKELDYANNVSVIGGADPITVYSEAALADLAISTTWAYEGDDSDKNVDKNNGYDGGAPIYLSLTGNSNTPADVLGRIAFEYDNSDGSLQFNGIPIPSGGGLIFTSVNGAYTSVTVVDASGQTLGSLDVSAMSLSGTVSPTSISGKYLKYMPEHGSISDTDVDIDFKATIINPDSHDTKVVESGNWGADAANPNFTSPFGDAMADTATADGDSRAPDKATVVQKVDAVADKPEGVNIDITDANSKAELDYTSVTERETWSKATGFETDTFKPNYGEGKPFDVTVTVTVDKFPDMDGSETHYVLVEVPGGPIDSGTASNFVDLTGSGLSYAGVITHGGKQYFQLEVIDPKAPAIEAEITLKTPAIAGDDSYTLKVVGMSVEQAQDTSAPYDNPNNSGAELITSNNTAFTDNGKTITFDVDAITSKLTVKTGWAPEGNDIAQHRDDISNADYYKTLSWNLRSGYDINKGAVVNVSLDGTDKGDSLQSVTFSYKSADGTLYVYNKNGVATKIDPGCKLELKYESDGTITLNIYSPTDDENPIASVSNVSATASVDGKVTGLTLYFQPSGDIDTDAEYIQLDYSVVVEGAHGQTVTYNSTSHVTIDAAADLATLAVEPKGAYEDNDQSAAAVGEKVTLTFKDVDFTDYSDKSEDHYLLIQKAATTKDAAGNPAANVELVLETAPNGTATVVLTGTKGGDTFTQTVVFNADGSVASVTITGPGITTPIVDSDLVGNHSNDTYIRIPVSDIFLGLTGGDVRADVNVIAPVVTKDVTVTATIGAQSVEEAATPTNGNDPLATGGNREVLDDNNVATVTKDVTFDVGVVGSDPEVKLVTEAIYENLTPNAHLGDAVIAAYIAKMDAWVGAGKDPATQPQAPEGMVLGADDYPRTDDGATFEISGLNQGETGSITFTFTLRNGAAFTEGTEGPDGDSMRFEYKGQPYEGALSQDGKTWTVTINGLKDDPAGVDGVDATLVFKPGFNFNSDDWNISYDITVVDDKSKESSIWHSGTGTDDPENGIYYQDNDMVLVVDAVAQKPDMTGIDENVATGDDGALHTHLDRGGNSAELKTTVTFHDYKDLSETHYVLVEVQPGCTPTSVSVDGHGQPLAYAGQQLVTLPDGSQSLFYRYEIPKDVVLDNNGVLKVTVEINTADVADGTGIRIGAMAWEDDARIGDGIPNHEIKEGANDKEATADGNHIVDSNNVAIELVGPIILNFSQVNGFKLVTDTIYDNDTPNAHTGDNTRAYGTVVEIKLNDTTNDSWTQAQFAYDDKAGTLYYMPTLESLLASGDLTQAQLDDPDFDFEAFAARYAIAANGSDVSEWKENYEFRFVPHNGINESTDYSDVDPKLEYAITLYDKQSGDTKTYITDYFKNADGDVVDKTGWFTEDLRDSGAHTIVADAVAQQPGKDIDTPENPVPGTPGGEEDAPITFTFNVSASFRDISDSSEKHYILVEALPNSDIDPVAGQYTVEGTYTRWDEAAGEYITYHKLLINQEWLAGQQDGKVTITVAYEVSSRWAAGYDDATIRTGALSDEGKGTHGSEGVTLDEDGKYLHGGYHNNQSFVEGGDVDIKFEHGPGTFWVDTAYENNRPDAHKGSDAVDYANISLDPDEAYVTITVKEGSSGSIVLANGDSLSAYQNPDGSYTIPTSLEVAYKADEGADKYTDTDAVITYKYHDNNTAWGGSADGAKDFTVIVDAVAQLPENLDATVKSGDYLGKDVGNDISIFVKADFADNDTSETHYILVEAKPGFAVEDAEDEFVYIGGTAYYKVDVTGQTPGQDGYEIKLSLEGNAHASDGKHDFQVGAMTEESAGTDSGGPVYTGGNDDTRDLEGRVDNNTSWVVTEKVTVEVSVINSSLSMKTTGTYEVGDGAGANDGVITLSGIAASQSDVLTELTISYDASRGTLTLDNDTTNGIPITTGNYVIINGVSCTVTHVNGVLTITSNDQTTGLKSVPEFKFVPDTYLHDSTDVNLTWSAKVLDTKSGDTYNTGNQTTKVVVDAVAQAPEVSDVSFVSATGGTTINGSSSDPRDRTGELSMTLTFSDYKYNDGTPSDEAHYAVMKVDGEWKCDSITINGVRYDDTTDPKIEIIFDSSNKPYYAVKIDPQTLIDNDGEVEVSFGITAPKVTADISSVPTVGGVSIEPDTGKGLDAELNMANNWALGKADLDDILKVGVVETTPTPTPGPEDDPDYIPLGGGTEGQEVGLDFSGMVNLGANESITSVSFTVPNGCTLTYGNPGTTYNGGESVTLNAPDLAGGVVLKTTNQYQSGEIELNGVSITVTDVSGDFKVFPDLSGSVFIQGTASGATLGVPVAGDLTELADHQTATVDLTLTGALTDTVGETLYYYIQASSDIASVNVGGATYTAQSAPDGLGLTGQWYIIPASAASTTATVTMRKGDGDDFDVQVYAVGKQTADLGAESDVYATSTPETVTIDRSGIDFNRDPESTTTQAAPCVKEVSLDDDKGSGIQVNLIELAGITDRDTMDTLTITQLNDETLPAEGHWTLTFGTGATLTVDPDGTALLTGATVADLGNALLKITVTDDYATGTPATGYVNLTLKDVVNTPPEGIEKSVDIVSAQARVLTGLLSSLFTDEGLVTATSVTINGNTTSLTGLADTASTTIPDGKGGSLVITRGGDDFSYEYTSVSAALTGDVTFSIAGVDEKGLPSNSNGTLEFTYKGLALGEGDVNGASWTDGALISATGGNEIHTGSGNDTIILSGSGSTVHSGGGDDIINVQGTGHTVYGEGGNDTIALSGSGHAVYGGDGNDSITGTNTGGAIEGGAGNDYISVVGAASVHGGDGADTIVGHGGGILNGGQGSDLLFGGYGDTFVWSAGDLTGGATDTISGFSVSKGDVLQIGDVLDSSGSVSFDGSSISLVLTNGSETQNLTVQLAPDAEFQAFSETYQALTGVESAQHELLMDFITKMTNN